MRPVGDPPLCDCHGEPKLWHADKGCKVGGYWTCAVKNRERCRRYHEENRDKELERFRRWREANPDKKREQNARRLKVGGMYLGMVGFTETEIKEMIDGKAH